MNHTAPPLHGVNLGGWLVLEKWITPGLFSGTTATDEYTWCLQKAKTKKELLFQHRQTFITKQDFAWLAARGINAVRIPIGHWIFGDVEPYEGAIQHLDFAVEAAGKVGIRVLVDLHAAPGSQNGWDHSGRAGEVSWHKQSDNIARSVAVLERLAERYKHATNLYGFEVLNEPHWDIPLDVLQAYYQQAYRAIRKHCPDTVAVVISDAFRPYEWRSALAAPDYAHVVLDTHLYQVFDDADKALDGPGHIHKTVTVWREQLARMRRDTPVLVGEWSTALDEQSLRGLHGFNRDITLRAYAAAQLMIFQNTAAWFYWTYRTEIPGAWSFHDAVEKGWLPAQYGEWL